MAFSYFSNFYFYFLFFYNNDNLKYSNVRGGDLKSNAKEQAHYLGQLA